MKWMCYNCGADVTGTTKCAECGFSLGDRSRAVPTVPLKPLVPRTAYVALDTVPPKREDVSVELPEPKRVPGPPLVDRVFLTSARALTGVSILTVLFVLAFFTVVFVKAFTG